MKKKIIPALFSLLMLSLIGVSLFYWLKPETQEFTEFKSSKKKNKNTEQLKTSNNFQDNQKEIKRVPANREKLQIKPKLVTKSPFMKAQQINLQKSPLFASAVTTEIDNTFEVDGEEIALVSNMYAIREADYDNQGDFIERRLNYVLIFSDKAPLKSVEIVQNQKTGNFLIFTGILKLKLNDFNELYRLDLGASYSIQEEYAYMNRALIKFTSYHDTIESYEALKKHAAVESVEVELLEYARSNK